jgi:site-specific recombinase XerD
MRIIQTPPPDIGATTLEAFRHHLVKRDLAPATVTAYLDDLKRFWTWLCRIHDRHPPPLNQVRIVDLAAFRAHLIHDQAQTPATVNRRLQGLRLFFRWMYDHDSMADNPATHLRFMRRPSAQQPPALIRREVLAFVHAAAHSPHKLAPRNVAIVQLMLQAGLRVGETTALTHGDLQLKSRSGSVHVRDGKGLKARDVPLNRTARQALQAYLATLASWTAQTVVFRSKRGTPLAVRSVQAVITRLADQAGIDRIPVSAHTLRHTFAAFYLQQHPGKLRQLAYLLGHESLDTTAIYTRPSPDDVADDLERSPLNVFDL